VARANCISRAAVSSFDQLLNDTLMSQLWGLSQPVTHSVTPAVKDVVQDDKESRSSSHSLLWSSGDLHRTAKQGQCLLSFFPITCGWDGLKPVRLHGLLNHSGLSQEQIRKTMYQPCLETPASSEQAWDMLLATITRPPGAPEPRKRPCRCKGDQQTWLVLFTGHELA